MVFLININQPYSVDNCPFEKQSNGFLTVMIDYSGVNARLSESVRDELAVYYKNRCIYSQSLNAPFTAKFPIAIPVKNLYIPADIKRVRLSKKVNQRFLNATLRAVEIITKFDEYVANLNINEGNKICNSCHSMHFPYSLIMDKNVVETVCREMKICFRSIHANVGDDDYDDELVIVIGDCEPRTISKKSVTNGKLMCECLGDLNMSLYCSLHKFFDE